MKLLYSFLIVIISLQVNSQNQQLQKIDSIVESKIKDTDPALFVGIVKDGKIIYQKSKGLVNLQHQVKASDESVSNIASTAKQFVALMVLQLSMEEKLSLEDDIRKFLPTFYPKVKEEIKIRHLLNHTSGIRDFYDLMSIQQEPWWKRVGFDNGDAIKLLEKQEDLAFAPGTKYLYSNSGYTLLTKIISEATGEDFHTYSKRFFENLEMKNTQFLKNYMYVIPNQALPYSDWGDGVWQEYPMVVSLYGDGFLFTSIKDQMIFEKAVQNANFNNDVLLIESQKPIKNSEIKTYGFGLELEDKMYRKAVHHSGSTGSYHSQMVRYPNEKLTVFVMSNNSRLWSGFIADEVAYHLLPKLKSKKGYDDKINEKLNLSVEKDIVGQYQSEGDYLTRVYLEEGKLFTRNGNNNPIELVNEDQNIYYRKRNKDAKIGFFGNEMKLFFDSGKTISYRKIDAEKPTLADIESYVGEYQNNEIDVKFTITKDDNNTLSFYQDKWRKPRKLEVLNRNELLVSDYILKVKRDKFNRVTNLLLTTNRVQNLNFTKKSNLQYQPKIEIEEGSIQVSNIGDKNGTTQILVTKNDKKGNEIWFKKYGGNAYDKANSIYKTDNGYLIIGSTSSYGKGNYDVLVFEVDENGKKIWQKTYGSFYNDYGLAAEKTNKGYLIKGTKQDCPNNSDIHRKCSTMVWFISIDKQGNQLSNSILEEVVN